jgi:hypothetical protein
MKWLARGLQQSFPIKINKIKIKKKEDNNEVLVLQHV